MSSRSPSGRQKKKKNGSPASPKKPVTTVAALFRKQLQQQQQAQSDGHTNSTGRTSDSEDVAFVGEEQASVRFSSPSSHQQDVPEGGTSARLVGEASSRVQKDGSSETGQKVAQSRQAEPKRRLSRRLSLRRESQAKKGAETNQKGAETHQKGAKTNQKGAETNQKGAEANQGERGGSTAVTAVNEQGDGSEMGFSLKSRSVHSSSESEGCVKEAVPTSDTDCSITCVSGPRFVERSTRRGDAGETTSVRCKSVGDATPTSSSSKGKLSLKRKGTLHDRQSASLSSPKTAKLGSNTEPPENSSIRTAATEHGSSAVPVFSVFEQSSSEQVKSPGNKGSSFLTPMTPTPGGPKPTAGDQTESPAGSSSVTKNTQPSPQGRGTKLAKWRYCGEAKANKTRGESSKQTASEAEDKEGEKGTENVDDDGEDTKEETLYRVPYYLENFNTVIKSVFADDYNAQLFSEEDLHYVERFNDLSEACQKLYVRLFSRKVAWLATGKIRYPDIADHLGPCLEELVNADLLASGDLLDDVSAVLGAMSAPDLRTLAKSYHVNPMGQQKGQIIQTLVVKCQQSTVASLFGQKIGGVKAAMLKRGKKLLGPVYRLVREGRAVFVRTMMLFSLINTRGDDNSGNGGQGQLFQMLLVNLGHMVYPPYTVNRHTRIFSCRQDLIRFEEVLQVENELLGHTTSGNWKAAYPSYLTAKESYDKLAKDSAVLGWDRSLPEFLRSYTAGSVLVRLLNQGIEILQRRKDYRAAVALIRELLAQSVYNLELHGYWWERLALNLDVHLKQPEQALQAIHQALADPLVRTGHRLALFLRAETICTKPKSPFRQRLKEFVHEPLAELPKTVVEGCVLPHTLPAGLRYQFITDTPTGEGEVTMCNVEHVVLDHYRGNGFPQGIHAEGSVVSTLFCLCLWDVLFMDMEDAFHGPYQTSPLDLHTDAFYQRRQKTVDDRLAAIEGSDEESLHAMVGTTWERHSGVTCAGINWERFNSVAEVQGLVSCMGGRVLCGVLRRYVQQPRHTRSGFPDLTLWNTATKQLKICEVKGPGDRLSHKQMMWLDYLLKLGVDAEVCHVKPVGVKKLKPNPKLDS